jgi:hypothetical protein
MKINTWQEITSSVDPLECVMPVRLDFADAEHIGNAWFNLDRSLARLDPDALINLIEETNMTYTAYASDTQTDPYTLEFLNELRKRANDLLSKRLPALEP